MPRLVKALYQKRYGADYETFMAPQFKPLENALKGNAWFMNDLKKTTEAAFSNFLSADPRTIDFVENIGEQYCKAAASNPPKPLYAVMGALHVSRVMETLKSAQAKLPVQFRFNETPEEMMRVWRGRHDMLVQGFSQR